MSIICNLCVFPNLNFWRVQAIFGVYSIRMGVRFYTSLVSDYELSAFDACVCVRARSLLHSLSSCLSLTHAFNYAFELWIQLQWATADHVEQSLSTKAPIRAYLVSLHSLSSNSSIWYTHATVSASLYSLFMVLVVCYCVYCKPWLGSSPVHADPRKILPSIYSTRNTSKSLFECCCFLFVLGAHKNRMHFFVVFLFRATFA